jgi:hypothetical protein
MNRIKDFGPDVISKILQVADDLVEAIPVPQLDNVFKNNPAWTQPSGEIENEVRCAAALLASRPGSFGRAVIRALGRREKQIDIAASKSARRLTLRLQFADIYRCAGEIVLECPRRQFPLLSWTCFAVLAVRAQVRAWHP